MITALGESLEAGRHCIIADPDKCKNYREFGKKLYALKEKVEDGGTASDSVLSEIRSLRKEFEKDIAGYNAEECGTCKWLKEQSNKAQGSKTAGMADRLNNMMGD